jgi:Mg-chelatase subunit ChlD
MTFLAPSLLALGIALTAIPIVIHFLNRRRYKTVQWAAMSYLLAAMKSNRRRLRFESLLLLLARCAVLALLGLAIARPLGCSDSKWAALAGRQAGLHILVIDDSYSMAYEAGRPDAPTQLDQARRVAKQVIARLESGTHEVAVIRAGAPARVLVRPTPDLDAAADAIDRIEQSFVGTDVAGAFRAAAELAEADKSSVNKTLHLITDCTNSAMTLDPKLPETAQAMAARCRLMVYNLGLSTQWNQSVVGLSATDALVRVGFGSDLQARVAGFGGGETQLEWLLDGKPLPGAATIRPDAKPAPVTQSQAAFDRPGPVVAQASIASNDRLKLDDVRRQVIDVVGDMKVLIVEGKRGIGALEGSGAFLQLALAPPIDPTAQVKASRYINPTSISDLELPGTVLADYRAVILAGVGSMSPATASVLKAYVEQGGSVMVFMGEAVSGEGYNTTLGAQGLLPGTLVARADAGPDKGFSFEFDPANPHPVLSAFRNIEKSGLENVQVTTYWRVQPDPKVNAQTVLKFRPTASDQPADPAITVQDVGRGRVVFVATSADAEWSTLVAKPAYVTLVHELLGSAVGGGEAWMNLEVGQTLELPASLHLTATPLLRETEQRSATLTQIDRGDGVMVWRSSPLARPGLYRVEAGDQVWPVAVNVSPDEADVRTLDAASLKHALGDIDFELLGDAISTDEERSARSVSDWSWPLMLLVVPLLFAESLMAWRFSRGKGTT